MPRAYKITTTRSQHRKLEALAGRARAPAGLVRRARVILMSAAGMSSVDIAVWVELSREAIGRIRRRFVQEGVEGLADRPKAGRKDHAVAAATVERVVQLAGGPGRAVAEAFGGVRLRDEPDDRDRCSQQQQQCWVAEASHRTRHDRRRWSRPRRARREPLSRRALDRPRGAGARGGRQLLAP